VNHEYQSPVAVFEGTVQSQSAPCSASSSWIKSEITALSTLTSASAMASPAAAASLSGGNRLPATASSESEPARLSRNVLRRPSVVIAV